MSGLEATETPYPPGFFLCPTHFRYFLRRFLHCIYLCKLDCSNRVCQQCLHCLMNLHRRKSGLGIALPPTHLSKTYGEKITLWAYNVSFTCIRSMFQWYFRFSGKGESAPLSHQKSGGALARRGFRGDMTAGAWRFLYRMSSTRSQNSSIGRTVGGSS